LALPEYGLIFEMSFMTRLEFGHVREVFPTARDSIMLNFPCFQSEMPIYGANSGGPVFDLKGRICGVNCSSYAGTDISFHIPSNALLNLWAAEIGFIPEDPTPRGRTILELGLAKRTPFDPPVAQVFFSLWVRILLKPRQIFFKIMSWVRWLAHEKENHTK
jgi:hypothetical protein